MKQRAKIKWNKEMQSWHATYSDGDQKYCEGTLADALDVVTMWETDQLRAQQEVSG